MNAQSVNHPLFPLIPQDILRTTSMPDSGLKMHT